MNKVWRYFQVLLLFQLIYPVFFKYIDEHLIYLAKGMEQDKKHNFPKLENEYQQLSVLKGLNSILFSYIHKNLINRVNLIKEFQEENNLYQLNFIRGVDVLWYVT